MEGSLLEDLCVNYLQRVRGCTETYYDDDNVRFKLGLPSKSACRCADVLSLHQPERIGVQAITIAEAKSAGSASLDHIAEQLGTAAAAAFRSFGADIEINLMVFTDRLVWNTRLADDTSTPVHIIASRRNWPHRELVPTLYDRIGGALVAPKIDARLKGQFGGFERAVKALPIEVVLASQLSERPRRRGATGR
jgi:hypothetical protein